MLILSLIAALAAGPGSGALPGEVTITTREYRDLADAAARAQAARTLGDRGDAVVSGARFAVVCQDDRASFEESFDVRSDAHDWTLVPVMSTSLERAELTPPSGGFFFTAKDGSLSLALAAAGAWHGRLAATLHPTEGEDGWRKVALTLPGFPVQAGRIEVKGADMEVDVAGAETLSRAAGAAATALEVAARPGASITVAWREKTHRERRREGPLAANGDLYLRSQVIGGELITDVHARVVASSGSIGGIDLTLPAGARPLFLRGPSLLDWSAQDGHVRAARIAASPEPLEAHLRFTLPLPDESRIELPLPALVVPGKVTTYLDFRAPEGQLAEAIDNGGFLVTEPDQLPSAFRTLAADAQEVLRPGAGPPPLAPPVYRIHRLAAAAVLSAQVTREGGEILVARSGRTLSRIEYAVRSSAKSFLVLTLPPGTRLWGAEVEGHPILAAEPAPGAVALPLRSARGGEAQVTVYLLGQVQLPEREGPIDLPLPATDVPVSRLSFSLSLPSDAQYKLDGSDYAPAVAAPPDDEGDDGEPEATEDDRGEFERRVIEVLAEESSGPGRTPIVPRWPDVPVTLSVGSDLPRGQPPPIRILRDPLPRKAEWK